MSNRFCSFPQTRFWHELRDHLSALPGATVLDFTDAPTVGSWLDFSFQGQHFTINAESGEFVFFLKDSGCPEPVRAAVIKHFESLLAERTDYGDGDGIPLRRG